MSFAKFSDVRDLQQSGLLACALLDTLVINPSVTVLKISHYSCSASEIVVFIMISYYNSNIKISFHHDPHLVWMNILHQRNHAAGRHASPPSFLLAWLYEAFYAALGEEAFFRGFRGGLLIRRLGFSIGNLLQAALFMLPRTLLLTISLGLWPLLLIQLLAGWLQGWLFYRSGSTVSLPGWHHHLSYVQVEIS